MFSRIFLTFCVVAFVTANDVKEDNDDGFKISLEKLRFIPPELLCTLCHNVVHKLRQGILDDPAGFQVNMLKSCDNYPDLEDQIKCRTAFRDNKKMQQLLDDNAPTKMCRSKKLCKEDEEPLPPQAFPMMGPRPIPKGMNPIPKVHQPIIPKDNIPGPVFPEPEESQ